MRFAIETWDPEYGAPSGPDGSAGPESEAVDILVDVEVAAAAWGPIRPQGSPARSVVAVDGVRRIEARVWIDEPDAAGVGVAEGICASYGAGAVHCAATARVVSAEVRRRLFTASDVAESIATRHGTFEVRRTTRADGEDLSLRLQAAMGDLEAEIAASVSEHAAELVLVDGPLRERRLIAHAVGYVKTHQRNYGGELVGRTVRALGAGERTPLFQIGGRFARYSWYARLPGPAGHPWAGVVRCEVAPDLAVPEVRAVADRVVATLPRLASTPHKDPRAPQNLHPIAGLERELRRRLGDPTLLHRALRAAAG